MRLLYTCTDFGIPPDGTKGPSIHLRAITRALNDAGHELLLLSPKPGPEVGHPAQRLLPPGCPPVDREVRRLRRWLRDREFDDTLSRELRPLFYNTWALEPALAALRARPVHAVIERLSLFGHLGVDLADALDLPLMLEVNALLTEEARRFRSLQHLELAESIEQRVLRRADAITVVSEPLAQRLIQSGIEQQKIHVVPNGVDLNLFDVQAKSDPLSLHMEGRFVVGFVGSLKVWHGVDVLIDAFARLHADDPKVRLLIVGHGPQEKDLQARVAQRGLSGAVVFTGPVPHELIPACVAAMETAVAPFQPMNGFYFSPIKLFEYMAGGACVVASRLGQIEEVIDEGETGLMCEAGNAEDLYAALRRLHRSPDLRRTLAANARRAVCARHTWAHAADKTIHAISAAIRCAEARHAAPTRAAS